MKIKRYSPIIHGSETGLAMERAMIEDPNGKWVNFDEVMEGLTSAFTQIGKQFYQIIKEEEK